MDFRRDLLNNLTKINSYKYEKYIYELEKLIIKINEYIKDFNYPNNKININNLNYVIINKKEEFNIFFNRLIKYYNYYLINDSDIIPYILNDYIKLINFLQKNNILNNNIIN